jgi:tol-pal system protein YbgF
LAFGVKRLLAEVLLTSVLVLPVSAQSQSEAQLALRIQQLEEQIRLLTGQVEGLQFQLTQMQTLLERMTADNEFRFQQLEGGAPPATPPAQTGGALQAPAVDSNTTAGLPAEEQADMPMDFDLGESADPLVGTGQTGQGELANLGAGRPLDLSLDGGTPVNGDAVAQYNAGYDAIVRGDYAFAEDQFRQFVQLYPDDPQAPDATNWLGEALLQRQAYDEAADVLLTGFQKYPEAPRAPDILLKLGVALAGAGEQETACRTFAEVVKRYPAVTPAFQSRLADERARAQCPA